MFSAEDSWVPITNKAYENKKDWVSVWASHSSFKKSHTQVYGYPGWGDDESEANHKKKICYTSGISCNLHGYGSHSYILHDKLCKEGHFDEGKFLEIKEV